jgi:integrase/recombinase XerD
VRRGKGRKARIVFIGAKARKALLAYLRHRPTARPCDPLWIAEDGHRLAYSGLVSIVRRRAVQAGVPRPSLHSFRRGFAILSHRAGADVLQLQRLLGHSDLSVLRRYLRLEEDDLRRAHERSGPVDNLL